MDRGIPTKRYCRRCDNRNGSVLSGRYAQEQNSQHEKQWLELPWQKVRDSVEVKLYRA